MTSSQTTGETELFGATLSSGSPEHQDEELHEKVSNLPDETHDEVNEMDFRCQRDEVSCGDVLEKNCLTSEFGIKTYHESKR